MSVTATGLGSGLDINSIIDGLMKIEASSQDALKTKLTKNQSMVTQYQSLNTKFAALKSAASDLSLGLNWKVNKATSSDTSVTATAGSSATPGTFSFKVTSLAATHSLATSGTVASTSAVIGSGSLSIQIGSGAATSISLGDGKLSTVVANINAANAGVSASAIQVSPGQYKLQINSNTSGTAGAITTNLAAFSGAMGTMANVTAASDATLQVGTGPGAYTVTSSSNAVTDVLPGVTINVTQADPNKSITVTTGGDPDALASKVENLIKAANDTLSYIATNSKYDAANKKGGPLQGNQTARRLQQMVFSAVSDAVAGASLGGASNIGIKSQSDGTFAFDKTKFSAAYAANPEAVAGLFVEGGTNGITSLTKPGIAERLNAAAKLATDSVSGLLTTALSGINSSITDLNKQISNWDDRLAVRQANLKRQFTAMDTAVGAFKNQQTWLTGQLAGLATTSS